jgi:hypothetical protein
MAEGKRRANKKKKRTKKKQENRRIKVPVFSRKKRCQARIHARMVAASLSEKGECLAKLGHFEDA